jgi:hypothetical protein
LTDAVFILICLEFFGQTGATTSTTHDGAKKVLALIYDLGAFAALVTVWYCFPFLEEQAFE